MVQFLRGLAGVCRGVVRQSVTTWMSPRVTQRQRRSYATGSSGMKVTICGAAGCTGQPLALLLKQCPLIDEVALYDQCATCGFGVELSHVDTRPRVSSYSGRHMLGQALTGSAVVVIVARGECDSFERNAPILTEITLQICNMCPNCTTIVATEPIESMVPLVAEIQRLRNCYRPRHLLGCVELNCVRANTILADFLRVPPECTRVPVIGGTTPQTMVPVLSAACTPCILTQEQVECVTSCIMSGTECVCNAKGCQSATPCLSGAYAIARVVINVVRAMKGEKIQQCAYIDALGTCAPDCQFFSCDVILGAGGIEIYLGVPDLTKFENCLLCNVLPKIRNEQAKAIWLVYNMSKGSGCECLCGPCVCFQPPPVYPCYPPINWTGCCPDSCRDEYLSKICKDMTCTVGSSELRWKPRKADYDAERAAKLNNQLPLKTAAKEFKIPRSIEIEQKYAKKEYRRDCGRYSSPT